MTRKGDWIQTYTGRAYWPLDPRAEDVSIEDIAHSLAMQCRYTGHCRRFYSVAEHSYHVSKQVPSEWALQGLLHDATEAYLADIARPVKRFLTNYHEVEELNWRVIAGRFVVPFEMHESVKRADSAMLFAEKDALMGPSPYEWGVGIEWYPIAVRVRCWLPELAKQMFLQRFRELTE